MVTSQEVSNIYRIELLDLHKYEAYDLFHDIRLGNDYCYTKDAIARLSIILSLEKSGLSLKEINDYLMGDINKKRTLLVKKRQILLKTWHHYFHQKERIDQIINEMERNI
ncbi:MerR family transcriptional regulator [Candidatus Stoquefichus massiliensis]|uniref:MerR family transcriptional regulator n=1 Tax=Candidatus Stoquefichus massiliensis TaxID=1470350 RepID=UPI000481AC72|nr:MerR family transcriptional regulator [Candidatus Stoquefichus massiliensis]